MQIFLRLSDGFGATLRNKKEDSDFQCPKQESIWARTTAGDAALLRNRCIYTYVEDKVHTQ
jgi:hypothetical protein